MQSPVNSAAAVPGPGARADDAYDGELPPGKQDPLNGFLAISGAEAAFDAYFEEQCSRLGTKRPLDLYERNRNWPHFLKLAVICAARGWNAADFVHRAFSDPKRSSDCLMPADLTRKGVLESYAPDSGKASFRDEYEQCIRLLISDEASGSDERSLLVSPLTPFPAWFRVFYPEEVNMEIVGAWSETAKHEISGSSSLIEALKEIDPAKWERVRRVLWFGDEPKGGSK